MGKRKGLSKTVRFEVFKRDSFTCQYCGRKSPDVILRADHVKPVCEGGDDEMLNLVTACFDCNAGKGPRELSDASVLDKQRRQLEELQERREQLEMMIDWQRGLTGIRDALVDQVVKEWERLAPGFTASPTGRNNLKKWCRTYTVDELFDAMARASESYLVFEADGKVTSESWSEAFAKIPKIANIQRQVRKEPWMGRIMHAANLLAYKHGLPRGIYKKQIVEWMRLHYEAGVHEDDIFTGVEEATSFDEWMEEWGN